MNLLIYLLFLLPVASNTSVAPHEYHVSKCLAHYKTVERALQISLHFFIDDMELALKPNATAPTFLGTAQETEETETLLRNYIQKHLFFTVDRKQLEYTWIGRETTDGMGGIWCYFEVENINAPTEMNVHNSLFLELFEDQKNIVSLNFDSQGEVYYLFRNGKESETILMPH